MADLTHEKETKKLIEQILTPIVIEVTKRSGDYHACIQGHPGIWAAGRNLDEAIGDLIRHHAAKFNVIVEVKK